MLLIHFVPNGVSMKHITPFYMRVCLYDADRISRDNCARRISSHLLSARGETRKLKVSFEAKDTYSINSVNIDKNLNYFVGSGKVQAKIGPERWRTIYRFRIITKLTHLF
jgi:hypothetical protein